MGSSPLKPPAAAARAARRPAHSLMARVREREREWVVSSHQEERHSECPRRSSRHSPPCTPAQHHTPFNRTIFKKGLLPVYQKQRQQQQQSTRGDPRSTTDPSRTHTHDGGQTQSRSHGLSLTTAPSEQKEKALKQHAALERTLAGKGASIQVVPILLSFGGTV